MQAESILPKLIDMYRKRGYETLTGYNPYHFNGYMDAPFTHFIDKDGVTTAMFGLALQEIMFLEHFSDYMQPKKILVIGNSYGWSTLALALIFPQAAVLAIDPNEKGNVFTSQIATQHGLSVTAATGYSPQDVGALCDRHLADAVDFVLIDAVHDVPSMLADFGACYGKSHKDTVFLFHDVINWNLGVAFQKIRSDYSMEGYTLTRTPSGMAIAWKELKNDKFRDYIKVFADELGLFRSYRQAVITGIMDKVGMALEKL
jgi:predicted O-methyltransferase YrrM